MLLRHLNYNMILHKKSTTQLLDAEVVSYKNGKETYKTLDTDAGFHEIGISWPKESYFPLGWSSHKGSTYIKVNISKETTYGVDAELNENDEKNYSFLATAKKLITIHKVRRSRKNI
jgi:hypothetical protein